MLPSLQKHGPPKGHLTERGSNLSVVNSKSNSHVTIFNLIKEND